MQAQDLIDELKKLSPTEEVAVEVGGKLREIGHVRRATGGEQRVGDKVIYGIVTTVPPRGGW